MLNQKLVIMVDVELKDRLEKLSARTELPMSVFVRRALALVDNDQLTQQSPEVE